MIAGIVILSLATTIPTDSYPLRPFAHVVWRQTFSHTASVQTQVILGRTYYSFQRDVPGSWGMPAFLEMAVGQVGTQRTWLAAIPLDSGGSGEAFTIAVFRAEGNAARYVGSLSVGDRLSAQVYGGELYVTTPARDAHACNACYTRIHLLNYTLGQGQLRKISDTIVQGREYFMRHPRTYNVVGRIVSVSTIRGSRYAKVAGAFPGLYKIASGVDIGDVTAERKLLLVCHFDPDPKLDYDWIVTAIYPYIGGLQ